MEASTSSGTSPTPTRRPSTWTSNMRSNHSTASRNPLPAVTRAVTPASMPAGVRRTAVDGCTMPPEAHQQGGERVPRSIAVALAALLLMLVAGPASAQARKRFVGPGDSIQAAVDASKRGDKILVTGVHRENVQISKDGIRLLGFDAVLL